MTMERLRDEFNRESYSVWSWGNSGRCLIYEDVRTEDGAIEWAKVIRGPVVVVKNTERIVFESNLPEQVDSAETPTRPE